MVAAEVNGSGAGRAGQRPKRHMVGPAWLPGRRAVEWQRGQSLPGHLVSGTKPLCFCHCHADCWPPRDASGYSLRMPCPHPAAFTRQKNGGCGVALFAKTLEWLPLWGGGAAECMQRPPSPLWSPQPLPVTSSPSSQSPSPHVRGQSFWAGSAPSGMVSFVLLVSPVVFTSLGEVSVRSDGSLTFPSRVFPAGCAVRGSTSPAPPAPGSTPELPRRLIPPPLAGSTHCCSWTCRRRGLVLPPGFARSALPVCWDRGFHTCREGGPEARAMSALYLSNFFGLRLQGNHFRFQHLTKTKQNKARTAENEGPTALLCSESTVNVLAESLPDIE